MQATRGTSVADASGAGLDVPPRRSVRVVMAGTFALVYAADQVTKVLAVRHLADGTAHPFLGSLLRLRLTRNAGAAFSTGTGYTVVLSLLALAAVVVVVWFGRRVATTGWAVAFGLLLAGIGGNLTDRLLRSPGPLRGQVVDFLELPHWPIFNVADVGINLAAVVILVQVFRGVGLRGGRAERR